MSQNDSNATTSSRLKLSTMLSTNRPVILDGALATHLESLGLDLSPTLWSGSALISNPELIYRTHTDYYQAGAEIAITASYQASILGLTTHLWSNSSIPESTLTSAEAGEMVKKSVVLAQVSIPQYSTSMTS